MLEAPEAGEYELKVTFASDHRDGKATITAGLVTVQLQISAIQQRRYIARIKLPAGKTKLSVDVVFDEIKRGPHQVTLTRTNEEHE